MAGLIVQGSGAGVAPEVRVFDADTGAQVSSFLAFDPRQRSGVRVAVGDVNGDGSLDIIAAPGPGAPPVVKIFSSTDGTLLGQFAVPNAISAGGLWVAAGDVNGDGRADIIVSPGRGAPWIQVYTGLSGTPVTFFRADADGPRLGQFGGAKVAAGDLNGDGRADIVAIPAAGPAVARAFDGATGSLLGTYGSAARAPRAGASVTVGDVNGDRQPDVILATPVPGSPRLARVRAFQARGGATILDARVAEGAGAGGTLIAAVGQTGSASDTLALAPTGGAGARATVLSVLPATTTATPLAAAFRLATAGRGASIAAANSVTNSTPAVAVANLESPTSRALTPLQRLAYYDPASQKFVPIQADDPRLVGKDITVISHGWAPGYIGWVNYEAQKGQVLTWWGTELGQPGYDPSWKKTHPKSVTAADSAFLFSGTTADGVEVSPQGMAQSIVDRVNPATGAPADPNAVVLAYSWIDDSATGTYLDGSIPANAYKSEALTALNGERLASGLETALGGTAFTGKLQLVGHSHGSKVAAVAAVALQQAGMTVNQLTLLDSPEDDATVVGDAANFNWFSLAQLQGLNRANPSGTFVDNYISEFSVPYSGITFTGAPSGYGSNLSQVVDVNLTPDIYDNATDPGDRHSYSGYWYAGSGEPAVTFGNRVGQYWSPLLPANAGAASPIAGLPQYARQNWHFLSTPAGQQYVIQADPPTPAETVAFNPLGLAPISVTQDGTYAASGAVDYTTPSIYGQSGITFDYQFATAQPGDRLVIMADGGIAFAMDASLVGSGVHSATLSLDADPFVTHNIQVLLTSATANTTSQVVVSNFQSFEQTFL